MDLALHSTCQSNSHTFSLHHHALYELIRVACEVTASELHERYEKAAEKLYAGYPQISLGKRSRLNKPTNLLEYSIIVHGGAPKNCVYRVLDTELESVIDILEIPN